MMKRRKFNEVVLLIGMALLLPAAGLARTANMVEVRLELPMPAQIGLEGTESLLVAPFIVLSQEGEGRIEGSDLDVQAALERYLTRVMRRETDVNLVEIAAFTYPTYDLELLARDAAFWRSVGERSGADVILAGSVDFDVQDRSGYRVEEYPSPINGSTMFRQVLVEQTGFELDILLLVIDGATGEVLLSDNFKDFKTFESHQANPRQGMFENLYAMEDRLAGMFVPRQVEGSRLLLLD